MTVIAFKDGIMAADKQGELYCTKVVRTKVRKINGFLIGTAGETRSSEPIVQWFLSRSGIDKFPQLAADDRPNVLIFDGEALWLHEKGPYPMLVENKFFAIGSGGDAAMAAMYLGKSAIEAVEAACAVCVGCGGGIDCVTF